MSVGLTSVREVGGCKAFNDRMIDEVEKIWKEATVG
jgi:hypothetical protein